MNIDKSRTMVSKGTPRRKKEQLASLSSISFASHLGSYLGFLFLKGRIKKFDSSF